VGKEPEKGNISLMFFSDKSEELIGELNKKITLAACFLFDLLKDWN